MALPLVPLDSADEKQHRTVIATVLNELVKQYQRFDPWTAYTPIVTLVGGAGNTVPQYSTNTGRWQRSGNTVFCSVQLSGDGGNEGAGTGTLTISLPVAAASAIGSTNIPIGRITNGALQGIVFGQPAAGSSVISLIYFNTISTTAVLTGADQNNTSRSISLHFFYEADG